MKKKLKKKFIKSAKYIKKNDGACGDVICDNDCPLGGKFDCSTSEIRYHRACAFLKMMKKEKRKRKGTPEPTKKRRVEIYGCADHPKEVTDIGIFHQFINVYANYNPRYKGTNQMIKILKKIFRKV